ncbi:MAG TPA: trypsin-like peptidase domain-containing protein, partial [Acidobacteriota bacterium]|nr:trypsin-like peptidase domain-containing protein [Acidobacteriota bacterium]
VERDSYHSLPPFFEDFFGPEEQRSRQKSLGSGFVFRPDGFIITNNHVVNGADNITVRLSDKMELTAEVVGTDQATDLAILRIHADHDLPFIPLGDSDSLLVGDWVIAVGNPFPAQGLDRTVTVGVISALGRSSLYFGDETPVYQSYIQTDASINPGNSGGPLVSLNGEVVGINAAIASPTGSNVGIGFAIPVNFAKSIIPDLLVSGTVSRGWLGIEPRSLTWDDVEAEGLESADGVIVNRVLEGTPAEQAGLHVGDVILTVDGARVTDAQHFMQVIWQARAGATIDVGVVRRGRPEIISVTLGDRNAQLASSDGGTVQGNRVESMWLGIEVATATAELCDQMGSEYERGVIVTEIDRVGPAYEKGIRAGMIIAEIDHEPIRNRADYDEVVAALGDDTRAVSLMVYDQRGQTGYIAVRPERRR